MTEHEQKYEDLCKRFGIAWTDKSPKLVRETTDSLREKHAQDRHLNNVPLALWDGLAYSFMVYNRGSRLSLAEVVCMEKHAAMKLIGAID